MREGCTNSIALQAFFLFSITAFNLLHAGHFRDDGHPWPHGRSIFWLRRDWCVFFGSVADNFSSQPAVTSMPYASLGYFTQSPTAYIVQGPSHFLVFAQLLFWGFCLVRFQFSSQMCLSYLFGTFQWKDARKIVVTLHLATSSSPDISNSAEAG